MVNILLHWSKALEQSFDIPRLLDLRRRTRAVATEFTQQLSGHLATLAPLFNPRPIFGRFLRGSEKTTSKAIELAFSELSELYQSAHKSAPINLRDKFDTPIELMGATPAIEPLQYVYVANAGDGDKSITVTTPLRWALTYSNFSLDRFRQLIAEQDKATGHELEQCVLHFMMLHITLNKRPGIAALLDALRLPLSFEYLPQFGAVPIAVISAPISTMRPPDEIIIQSTEVSGGPLFEEVVNVDDVDAIRDPIKDQLQALVE